MPYISSTSTYPNKLTIGNKVSTNTQEKVKTQRKSKFIERLDKNQDNKVSKEEFDGPRNAFKRFDKNNDEYIDSSEAPSGPPKRR